ncbi:hypothetical protein [Echinimonas agarilytica]|uniref:Uncharacterized protein n=1 Tax=Echinimonas agarilytica TaxID=1215918 RepID=A0AA41W583_9GAMM|nr:hypothetical protein [Echinimonas agarilytica]MCM2679197.1 hypothetical protein [Echinimonas agarilytica]
MSKPVYIVAPVSSLSLRTRLLKLAKFVHGDLNRPISFHGWEREPGESEEKYLDFQIQSSTVLKGAGYGGQKVKIYYVFWMLKVFFLGLKLPARSTVWSLGFESAFPLVIASLFKKHRVIFDDADRFSMLFKLPFGLTRVVQTLEKYCSHHCAVHVVPGRSRYQFQSTKFYELKNLPSAFEITESKSLDIKFQRDSNRLVINVNGWLASHRGLEQALALAKKVESLPIDFLLVGKLQAEMTDAIEAQSNMTWVGQVSNSESLAYYQQSDLVLTYYDPAQEINRHAESNKWGDALALGIGIIVNEEVLTAHHLRDANVAISCPYHDVETLFEHVTELVKQPQKLVELKQNALAYYQQQGGYEEKVKGVFNTAEGATE